MTTDRAGLRLSGESDANAKLFDEAVSAYLGFSRATGKCAKTLLTAEPTMPMGNVLMGYFFMLMGSRPLVRRAERSLGAAREQEKAVTERERGHMNALAAWTHNDLAGAVEQWEAVLVDSPRDVLAAKMAHFGHFYLGNPQQIRDSIARVLPAWSEQDADYGFLLSMYAFGLEETGDYGAAERCGRRAIDINPRDSWGVHAVAHVLEMQGRHAEGIEWITGLEPSWREANNFRYHLAWHRTLYYLERGEADRALQLYDETVWDPEANEYLDLCNDVALLARLDMAGVDTGDRWQALGEVLSKHTQVNIFNFIDAHYALGLASGGQETAAIKMVDDLSSALSDDWASNDTYLNVAARVGFSLTSATVAYARGNHARVVELMQPIRYDIQLVGGSHAQRDLFNQLLINSAIKSNQLALARGLLAERVALKPNNIAAQQQYAVLLAQL